MTTLACSRASSRTIAWPIPLLPPVMMATLPFNGIVDSLGLIARKNGGAPAFEKGSGIQASKNFDQRRHQPGPSGLVTGADAGAIVAVEIFVEQKIVPPVRVALELLSDAEHWPPAALVAQKDPGQPIGDFAGDLEQVHRVAQARRTVDPEIAAIIEVVL